MEVVAGHDQVGAVGFQQHTRYGPHTRAFWDHGGDRLECVGEFGELGGEDRGSSAHTSASFSAGQRYSVRTPPWGPKNTRRAGYSVTSGVGNRRISESSSTPGVRTCSGGLFT